jgi:hypothetical protein
MDDLRALATELAVLVIAASVLGLLAGLILGWAAGRAVGRVVDPEPAPMPERVLVRPDPQLYLENEALRDEVAELQLRVDGLRADVAAARARRPVAAGGRRPEGVARVAAAGTRSSSDPAPPRSPSVRPVAPTARATPVAAGGRDTDPPARTSAGHVDTPPPEPRVRPTPVVAASATPVGAEAVGPSNRRRAAWRRRG